MRFNFLRNKARNSTFLFYCNNKVHLHTIIMYIFENPVLEQFSDHTYIQYMRVSGRRD